ncbi:unnamed protein product [Discula destructiva]
MSRRPPNPAAERQAKNQATLKSLLKLEPNKMCADCKRNKHPRWASWNLGVFICIRCSGIHRSMGVHISKVKSVDLDSWTDEQMQSILNWGNARANKYWEDKLAVGHTPSEAKIENFIRTKYELKRWVMDGPMPDPASLDVDGDDDVPLSLVKEKQTIERQESLRRSIGQSSTSAAAAAAAASPQPDFDLMGGDEPIPRASTAGPVASNVPPKAAPAPPKATNTNSSSLLGLDFLGAQPSPPSRPASTTGFGGSGGQSRPDLKQSILSLYATAPRPQAPQQQVSHSHSNSFGSMHSPTGSTAAPQMSQQPVQSHLNDAFSNLSFSNLSSPKSPPTTSSAFSGLGGGGGMSSSKSPPPDAFSGLSGGGFFNSSKPAAPKPAPTAQSSFSGFGDFTSSSTTTTPKPAAPASSAMNDLFDFSSSSSAFTPAPAPSAPISSPFNLTKSNPAAPAATTTSIPSGSDVWGGNAWADPAPKASTPLPDQAASSSSNDDFGGWGSMTGGSFANTSIVPGASGGLVTATTQPKISADEEFGGWTSSTGAAAAASGSGGGAKNVGGSEDLFSNVWQ